MSRPRLPLIERLMTYTAIDENDCWVWQGSRSSLGYGRIGVEGRMKRAHRVSYELHVGPIPEGLSIDHLCRNRACINPAHLEPVTHAENVRRGVSPSALNATKTHCKRGHEFTPENTITISGGYRSCRICMRQHQRNFARKYRELNPEKSRQEKRESYHRTKGNQ